MCTGPRVRTHAGPLGAASPSSGYAHPHRGATPVRTDATPRLDIESAVVIPSRTAPGKDPLARAGFRDRRPLGNDIDGRQSAGANER